MTRFSRHAGRCRALLLVSVAQVSLVACSSTSVATRSTKATDSLVAMADGGVSGAVDGSVSSVPYWQWWDPQCGSPGSACTNPSCSQVRLAVSPIGGCETEDILMTGCLPSGVTIGWTGYASTDHQVIAALLAPYTMTGLSQCTCNGCGGLPYPPACCPWMDGGGVEDARAEP